MEKWFVAAKKADFNQIAEQYGISPVLARIIRNRDITEDADIRRFLYGTGADLYAPGQMFHMQEAAELLWQHIRQGKRMRIIGDYDVDGICSTYILHTGLSECGACVDYVIPHRMKDGYGLNEQLIAEAAAEGIETIVTCDNGISAYEQIAYANSLGMTVIVTDHHEVPFTEQNGIREEKLPPAEIIVDPKQEACSYPFKGICGGVVAYKLVQALYENVGIPFPEAELLQFAAIATVCDVMELKDENRIIVKEGLKLLRTNPNPGIRALLEVNGIEQDKLNVYHLGFVLGPCMNATGRLDTARRALALLQSKERSQAVTIAGELKELNDSRKSLTAEGVKQAVEQIEQQHLAEDKVLVIYLEHCHESLAGIIAGRIREQYHKPVFILTDAKDGVKGSGRSIEAYHMYEEMTRIQELFLQFGGHKLAAGLSMIKENIQKFRQRLNENCTLTEDDFVPQVHIDVPMPVAYGTAELVRELELLEPYGTGNPKPLFAQKELRFIHGCKIGKNKNFAKYQIQDAVGNVREAVYFGDGEQFDAFVEQKFGPGAAASLYSGKPCEYLISITYQLGLNSFRGEEKIQIVMQNYC